MFYKYRLYCKTENTLKYVIALSPPTKCPDDPAHVFEQDSISVTEVDVKYNDGTPVELTLVDQKKLKQATIDKRTGELIALGWVWNGKVFSASAEAQRYWVGLKSAKELLGPSDYPIEINTLDDLEAYNVADETELLNMFATLFGTVKSRLGSGTDLKNQCRAATTQAALDAVVDNR